MIFRRSLQMFVTIKFMEPEALEYIDGYRSSSKYHYKGNINLILSAPHGGNLLPDDVPDRTDGIIARSSNVNSECHDRQQRCKTTVVKDSATIEFTENVVKELMSKWNYRPFVIIGKWHRRKVDFNREIIEGTLNHPEAIRAYENYHENINDAIDRVNQIYHKGLLIDIHGHSQGKYAMMGYMLSGEQLNQSDLSHPSFRTSIESLCANDRNGIVRGEKSFGTVFEQHELGVAYPSLINPKPGTRTFFSGGYIIRHYSSKINAIQTELPYEIRMGNSKHKNAQNFAQTIVEFMKMHKLLVTE